MGKVVVIIQSEDTTTTDIYEKVKETFTEDTPAGWVELFPDYDVFIVPDDEEFPDLS